MEAATDIYIAVKKMVDEANRQLEADDTLFGDVHAYARVENERNGMQRVMHMLEDDFGVMRPFPSLTAHLNDTRCAECGGPLEGWAGEHHSQQCSENAR